MNLERAYLRRKNITANSETIMVSACLAGVKCRYNGENSFNPILLNKLKNKTIIIFCPELLAGLPTPRLACNIHGGDGFDVLNGKASIIGVDGKDYTPKFVKGATLALKIALENKIKKAYLKNGSPTCSCNKICSGEKKKLIKGFGIFAALLKKNNIKIISL